MHKRGPTGSLRRKQGYLKFMCIEAACSAYFCKTGKYSFIVFLIVAKDVMQKKDDSENFGCNSQI